MRVKGQGRRWSERSRRRRVGALACKLVTAAVGQSGGRDRASGWIAAHGSHTRTVKRPVEVGARERERPQAAQLAQAGVQRCGGAVHARARQAQRGEVGIVAEQVRREQRCASHVQPAQRGAEGRAGAEQGDERAPAGGRSDAQRRQAAAALETAAGG